MIHVDVTKFDNIPNGGGWRFVGKQQGYRNQISTPGLPKGPTTSHGPEPHFSTQ